MANQFETFLKGYTFAAWINQSAHPHVDTVLGRVGIHLKDGGRFHFSINRGICPIEWSTAYAFKYPDLSLFDVLEEWATPEVWAYMKDQGLVEDNYDEARIRYNDLCNLVDHFGGVDFDEMIVGFIK
jgi:hypothetical protein